jgi:O-antigen ligase
VTIQTRPTRAGSSTDDRNPSDPAIRLDFAAYLAVCALFATIPWQDVVQIAGIGTVAKAVGLGAVVMCALAIGTFGGLRRPGESVLLVLLFTCWVVVSPVWSAFPDESVARVGTMLQLTLMVLITVHVTRTADRLAGLMGAFVVGDVILGLSVLQQRAGGLTLVRYTAEGTNPNDVAFLMCLGIPMAWYLVLRLRPKLLRLLLGGFVVLAIFVVVLTASRSALLLLVPALAIIPLNLRRLTPLARSVIGAVVLALTLATVTGALLVPSAPLQRLATTASEIQSGTLDNRTTLWGIGFKIFGQHPVLGVGAGVVPEYVGQSYPLQAGLHNTYLSIAVQFGIVGIVLFGLLLLSVVRRALAAPRPERSLAAVLGVVLVLGLIPRHWEFTKGTWAVIAILICLGEVAALKGHDPPSGRGGGPLRRTRGG